MQIAMRRVVLFILSGAILTAFCQLRGQAQDLDQLLESARAAQSTGSYNTAADLYRRATALSPLVPELWSNRGVVEFLADQVDASKASLKHALQLNGSLFTPKLFLGKAYIQTGRPAEALPYLNRAHSLRPKDLEVLLALGAASANLNRQREAASFYEQATHVAPENAQAWLGLGSASLEVVAADGRDLALASQTPWARGLYADELLAQGRPLEATEKYDAAFSAASHEQKVILTANVMWMRSHTEDFPLPPNSGEALDRLSSKLNAAPNAPASSACELAKHRSQSRADATAIAACAFWSGDYERSAALSSQVLRKSRRNAEALYWSVKANERVAVVALSRFEELAPKSAYVMVGDLYRDERKPDNALVEYKKALAIDSHDPAALMGAAAAYFTRNQLDEAAATDLIALSGRPSDVQLNLLMAEILVAKNELQQAKPYLTKCLAAPPEIQPRVHYLLGRIAAEDGDIQQAIRQLEMALPGDKDGSTHYQLSRLYRKTGNLAGAQKAQNEAKDLIKKRDANASIAVREATGTNQ